MVTSRACSLAPYPGVPASMLPYWDLSKPRFTALSRYDVAMKGATSKPLTLSLCCERTAMPSANCAARAAQFADGIAVLSQHNDKVKGFDVAPFIATSYLDNAVKRGLDKSQ